MGLPELLVRALDDVAAMAQATTVLPAVAAGRGPGAFGPPPAGARRERRPAVITAVPGVRVGHWSDTRALTGCTAVVLPEGTRASGEVRGGAPATREWELLTPGRRVERVDVVMLAGGSAFGLAACDGAMRWCEQQRRGHPSLAGPVPIVV